MKRRIVGMVVAGLVVGWAVSSSAGSEELVKNWNLEKADPANPAKPDYWKPAKPGCEWVKDGRDGGYCFKIGPAEWSYWEQDISLKSNTTYKLTLWMKSSVSGAGGDVAFYRIGSGGKYEGMLAFPGLTTDWKEYSKTFTTPADTPGPARIWPLSAQKKATLFFDDISLVEVKQVGGEETKIQPLVPSDAKEFNRLAMGWEKTREVLSLKDVVKSSDLEPEDAQTILIDSFEDPTNWKVSTFTGTNSFPCSFTASEEHLHQGRKASKLIFDCPAEWDEITLMPENPKWIDKVPATVDAWFYETPYYNLFVKILLELEDSTGEILQYRWVMMFAVDGWNLESLPIDMAGNPQYEFRYSGGNNNGRLDPPWRIKQIIVQSRKPAKGSFWIAGLSACCYDGKLAVALRHLEKRAKEISKRDLTKDEMEQLSSLRQSLNLLKEQVSGKGAVQLDEKVLANQLLSLKNGCKSLMLSVETRKKFKQFSQNQRLDYTVSFGTSMEKFFPEIGSFPGKPEDSIEISLAKNEYEGFQLVLVPFYNDLPDVKVSFSDLVARESKAKISKDNLSYHPVGYVRLPTAGYSAHRDGMWPDILLPQGEFSVQRGYVRPIWVNLYAPTETPAGDYEGTIKIMPANSHAMEIGLKVHVWDFSLPPRNNLPTGMGFSKRYIATYYQLPGVGWPLRKEYIDFFCAHKIETGIFGEAAELPTDLDYLKEKNATTRVLSINEQGKDDQEMFAQVYKMEKILKEKGLWEKTILFGFDECAAKGPKFEKALKAFKRAKELFPDLPTMSTAGTPCLSELSQFIDIWVPDVSYPPSIDSTIICERMKQGKKVWWYWTCETAPYPSFQIQGEAIDLRIIPWMSWKYKVNGFLYWGINYWAPNYSFVDRWPRREWDVHLCSQANHNSCGSLVYPGPGMELLSSIRLENWRDGMEDYEYLYLLKGLVEKLKETKSAKKAGRVRELENLSEIDPSMVKSFIQYTKDPDLLYKSRAKIAKAIESLKYESEP